MGLLSVVSLGVIDDDGGVNLNPFNSDAIANLGLMGIPQGIEFTQYSWDKLKHWLIPDMRQDREAMLNSSSTARRIVYGRTRAGCQIAYAETSGADSQNLNLVVVFAGHEIDSYQEIWFDDKKAATVSGGIVTVLDPFVDKAAIELFTGSQSSACASLISESAGNWTTDHKLSGCAYAYVKLTYSDGAYPSGVPSIKAVVKGKRVQDPRTGATAWSDNPILCIRDYMLTAEIHGGMGCDSDEVDDELAIASANISDQMVASDAVGGTEKRYTLNGVVGLDATPATIVKDMLTSCAGTAVYTGAEWRVYAGAPSSPVATVDESWLNGGISFKVGANKGELINTVKGMFTNAAEYWENTEFPPIFNADYLDEDLEELTADISLPFTTSQSTAQRLAKIVMERSRRGFTMSYPCNMKAFAIDAWDAIAVNNSQLDFTGAQFRVVSWGFAAMGGVALSLIEDSDDIYDWDATDPVATVSNEPLVLPDPWVIGAPTGLSVTDGPVTYPGSVTRSETVFTWESPSALATSYIVQLDGVDYALAITNRYVFANLVPAEYDFGVIAVNAAGSRSPVAETTHTVTTPSGTGTGAVAAASANATVSTVAVSTADAGAAYDSTAQSLINELKADLTTAISDFNAVANSLNDLKGKLRTAGLMTT